MRAKLRVVLIYLMVCAVALTSLALALGGAACSVGRVQTIGENQMNKFSSYEELEGFLKPELSIHPGSIWQGGHWGNTRGGVLFDINSSGAMKSMGIAESSSYSMDDGPSLTPKSSTDYSGTNNQVKNVDEADIIKTDGQYIYYTAGTSIYIVKAYPADSAELVSEIEMDGAPQQIFINGDRLVVFEYGGYWARYDSDDGDYLPNLSTKIYDISDRANPVLKSDVYSSDGSYVSSRMIGDYVYMIINEWVFDEDGQINLPRICIDDDVVEIAVGDIYYSDITDSGYGFTTVVAINIQDDDIEPSYASMLLGSAGTVYVSTDNIYITLHDYSNQDGQVTQIHRFSVDEEDIAYTACGQVPGGLLNQFSMDEHNGYFRVATTSRGPTEIDNWTTKNNVYVLDMDLEVVGKVEDLAPGERIYSVRFMGNRGYMVTFKQVDPLFAIDLSDPANPEVLGELKITGYSDYLHPYDENHLIGIGKEATEQGRFMGMKIALFDVSDISNPVEISKYEIGDRGTESPVLSDHKAFMFDKARNLMVMPVLIAEVDGNASSRRWGEYVWQGAYVFDISPETGIALKGGITHYDDGFDTEEYWDSRSLNDVKRSLYIDDVLYTISDGKMKMNDLETLDYIGQVELWDGKEDDHLNSLRISPGIPMWD